MKPFSSLSDYEERYHRFKTDPAMLKYCDRGGRHILWLPYSVQAREEGEPSTITYFKSREQLTMHQAWKSGNGPLKSKQSKDHCIYARMGK